MIDKRNLTYNLISQIIGFAVNICIGFFVTSFIVTKINAAAYGFVGLANDFIGYAQIITVALNSLAGRFITIELHRKNIDKANRYFTSVTIANIIFGVILLIVFGVVLIFMNKIFNIPQNILGDVQLLWGLLFINFILSILATTFQVSTFAKDKLYLTAIIKTGGNLLRLLVLVVTYGVFKPSVWYMGLAALISSIFIMISHIQLTNRLLPELKIKRTYFDRKAIQTVLSSGIWNSLTKLGGVLATGLDLLITNKIVGATAMGLVSIAKTVPGMILQFMGAVGSIFAPGLTKSFAKDGFSDMTEQTLFSIRLLGIFSGIPMAFLFIFGKDFFRLWMPTLDSDLLHRLSLLACLAFVFSMPMEGVWNVFTAANKVKVTSIYLFLNSLLSIAFVFILLPQVPDTNSKLYIIVGVSSVFSLIRALIFLPLYAARCLGQKWYILYSSIAKNTLYVVILTLLAWFIRKIDLSSCWRDFIISLIIFCFISFPVGLLVLLNKREKQSLCETIKKRIMSHAKNT